MEATVFNKKFIEYIGQREPAFYWEEVPKTMVWNDMDTNELCSDLGISIKCDSYDSVWECVNELCDAVADHYRKRGVDVHEV